MTTVSVIIPALPARIDRGWLDTAIHSIKSQDIADVDIQIIVGMEPDTGSRATKNPEINLVVEGDTQVAKINTAVECAEGHYLAILHDDDLWHPAFLRTALDALEKVEFVSSNSIELDEAGGVVAINDFPCPSGWLMPREIFLAVGLFDPAYRIHCDTEWLGRLSVTQAVKARAHLVEAMAPQPLIKIGPDWGFNQLSSRPGLRQLLKDAQPKPRLIHHRQSVPLVTRRLHDEGILQREEGQVNWHVEGNWEYTRMIHRFNRIPW